MAGKTLYDKLWDDHLVKQRDDGSALIYIDRHLLHEVTSPQAFEGLRLAGRKPWRIDANLATPDHNVPSLGSERASGVAGIVDEVSRIQVQTLDGNCEEFGIKEFLDRVYYPLMDKVDGMPYGLLISAGNDGTGAVREISKYLDSLAMNKAMPALIVKGEYSSDTSKRADELGLTLAAGLSVGMF